MTQPIYEIKTLTIAEVESSVLLLTHPDGMVWYIPIDPANSDYQRYLRWLENPDATDVANLHLAEVPAIIEATQPDEADLTEGTN